ncbi:MAG: hypothetical protein KAX65_16825 [Caldilineaceae bacterium]|nr:hypothetical protein [Caldilineaceae bacterium]
MKCEFCGMEAPRLHTHRKCCPDNPVVWAATRDALDDGDGYIVPANSYKAQRQPVSDTTLRKRYGTWAQVADAFGLRWRASRKRQDDIDRPLSADEQDWSQAEPEATYPLHGYKERQTETIYRLPMPGVGLRVVHEYITLR